MESEVIIEPIKNDIRKAVSNCFIPVGGIKKIAKGSVFIKVNGNTMVNSMTNHEVVLAVVELIKELGPTIKKIYVMDNCTMGAFTRLIFQYQNFAKRIKRAGATPLYLDEQKSVDINFNGSVINKPIPIPKILYENLIKNREENTYINIPRLKSHIFTGITVCVKNQYGLLYDQQKMEDHQLIDEKLVDLLGVFQPDYNIVDAISVVDWGPVAIYDDWIKSMGLLVGGKDAVAVDTVCSKLAGINNVEHLKLASKKNLGNNDLAKIHITPSMETIERYKIQLSEKITKKPPSWVTIIKGADGYCRSGCQFLETVFLILSRYSNGCKPCVGIFGKGHDTKKLDMLTGPFILSGPCAVLELKKYFKERSKKDDIKVYYINDHFNFTRMFSCAAKATGANLSELTGIFNSTVPKIMWQSLVARLHGSRNITNI